MRRPLLGHDAIVVRASQPGDRPAFVQPMAARVTDRLPEGAEWMYEVKLDGYRALLLKDRERVRIVSRNEKDLTLAYPSVAAAAGGDRRRDRGRRLMVSKR